MDFLNLNATKRIRSNVSSSNWTLTLSMAQRIMAHWANVVNAYSWLSQRSGMVAIAQS
jgi:hypothetical protein